MALGLNKHITNLATMNTYEYLCRSHEMISIAILIGLAAAKRGNYLILYFIGTACFVFSNSNIKY